MKSFRKTILCIIFVQLLSIIMFVPSFAINDARQTNKVTENNVTYDLSNLDGAANYFKQNPQLLSYSKSKYKENISKIDLFIKTTSNKQMKEKAKILMKELQNDSSNIPSFSFNLFNTLVSDFNLQSKLDQNSQSMRNTYNVAFAALIVSSGYNAVVAATGAYEVTGVYFADKERGGGDWDYKRYIGWNNSCDTYIDGGYISLRGEDIGNIHYGYVGSTYFPEIVLKSAAGLVQIAVGRPSSDFSSYFDDPNDQAQIQRGIDYYNTGTFY